MSGHQSNGDQFCHFVMCESDRVCLLEIESFTPDNQTVARAAAVWRPLAAAQDAQAEGGFVFMRGALA
ncbi:MAG: hypothetical protein U0075_06055 [Thermomicrobiales bacterium]